MANITFSESSGVNEGLYGNVQTPIRSVIIEAAEAFEAEDIAQELVKDVDSDHASEEYTYATSMDNWEVTEENGDHPTNGFQQGYEKTIKNRTWKSSFSISREMIDDGNIVKITDAARKFTKAYYRTRHEHIAAMYGAALAGSKTYTSGNAKFSTLCADGSALFAKDHKPLVSGGNQCNIFSDALTSDSLLYMESAMQDFRDDNGNILDIRPNTILIPNIPALKKAAFAAIGAEHDPSIQAGNGYNINYGRWNVIIWNYLNKYVKGEEQPWILLDTDYIQDNNAAVRQNRVNLEVNSMVEKNDANLWNGYSRWTSGFVDFRFAALGGSASGNQLIKA